MRPLKIAFLSRWLFEENRRAGVGGGMAQQLGEAVQALGHEVVALSQSPVVTAGLVQTQIGRLETWLSPRERRDGGFIALRDKLAKLRYGHRKVHSDAHALGEFLHRRGPFDLLWAQTEEPDGLVAAVAARSGLGLPPVLLQIHALRTVFRAGEPVPVARPALGLAFRQARIVIANSEMIARDALIYARAAGLSPAELAAKVRVIYPNVTREFLAEPVRAEVARAGPPRVLFLGALNRVKGATIFVEAALAVAEKSAAVFTVLGGATAKDRAFDRHWRELLRRAQPLLAADRLDLPGKVAPREVIDQIDRAALVVVPSLNDPFSRAVAEAVLRGRPVITTDRVGLADFVRAQGCGLVVAPGDPVVLAQAIFSGLHQQDELSARARQAALELATRLSPESVARQLVACFQALEAFTAPA